ncbi:MAG: helix-turn-helix transcriptional regulator [Eubacterium sp.]|nr:helix-turn-helix transcriptional regulator [Eubacterium sp.]
MVIYNKLFQKFSESEITSYTIRKYNLFGQEILRKFKMCSVTESEREDNKGKSDEEIIEQKLLEYKEKNKKDFKADVSTKTIEEICQLLQCQPQDIMEWTVDLNPKLSYKSKFLDASNNL